MVTEWWLLTKVHLVGSCRCPDTWGTWRCPVQWTPHTGTGIRLHSFHPRLFDCLCTRHQLLVRLDSRLCVLPRVTVTCPWLQLSEHNTKAGMRREELPYTSVQQDVLTNHIPHKHLNVKLDLERFQKTVPSGNFNCWSVHDKRINEKNLLVLGSQMLMCFFILYSFINI